MNTDKIFLLDYTLFEIQFDQYYKKITLVLIPWPTSIPPWEMAIVPSAWYIDIIAVNWEPKYAIPYLRGTTLIPRFRQRLFLKKDIHKFESKYLYNNTIIVFQNKRGWEAKKHQYRWDIKRKWETIWVKKLYLKSQLTTW